MKKLAVVLALGMTLMPLRAQQNGWNVSTDFVRLRIDFDEHVLSECMRYATFDSSRSHILDVGKDCEKIFLTLPQKTIFIPEISYEWNQQRIGMRGWYINSSDYARGSIHTPPPIENEDKSTTFFRGTIFVWEHSLGALTNTLEESGWTDIDWFIKNDLRLATIETYYAQVLSRFFEMRVGLKIAEIVNKRTTEVKNWAYVNPYYSWYIWDNNVTLLQKSQASAFLMGPYVGLTLNTKYVNLLVQGAPLFTPPHKLAHSHGHWDDIDDVYVDLIATDSLYYRIYYDGDFGFDSKTRALIPAGEISLTLTYPIEYKNLVIRFGVGAFGSVFLNTPIAPIWQVPGKWTWDGTTNWKTREKDLIFYGLSINLSIEWKGDKS